MALTVSPSEITLDAEWVDQILVTAFDGHYGGSQYWANNLDDEGTYFLKVATELPDDGGEMLFHQMLLVPTGPCAGEYSRVVLNKRNLSAAFTEIHNNYPGYIADYLRDGVREDDPGYIDAEAADLIVQLATFGEIVYG